ncbi:MAG TPA: rRNA maturation RNase YbeY [Syntrophales bacterium]|nr:rRNA maturation RNase YbeY [Syntrophales bacterium]
MLILIENRQKKINVDLQHVKRVLRKIMNYLDCKDKEISLLFVDDNEIRKINKHYLNRGYSTNVLTFSLSEGEYGNINPKVLGDIVISVETALKDAEEAGIELNDELEFLMVHGVLHLLNYNHENTSENEVKKMERREKEVFSILKK